MSTCNTSTLNPYIPSNAMPWNEMRVKHLYRRIAFSLSPAQMKAALARNPQELIEEIIVEAVNKPVAEDPGWGYLKRADLLEFDVPEDAPANRNYMKSLIYNNFYSGSLRDRLFLFWTNHFVAGYAKPHIPYLFNQMVMRQRNAIGNLKTFVREMGMNPLMHWYLNGNTNVAGAPNENFARELYELFTLGVDNGYTENDIMETARALTGWTNHNNFGPEFLFNSAQFDSGDKTIFGRTGNWGYDDVIDILFEERGSQVAQNICRKIYRDFVSYDNINENIVGVLAQTLVRNNYELAPVFRLLLKSEHFFDEAAIGGQIKAPIDLVLGFQNEMNTNYDPANVPTQDKRASDIAGYYLEQDVDEPPNVAGWTGDENWINSVTLPERWMRMEHIAIYQRWDARDYKSSEYEPFIELVHELFDPTETDYEKVAIGIMDFFLTKPLSDPDDYLDGIATFKSNVPNAYYNDGTWDLNYATVGEQVYNLIVKTILYLPEYQIK